MLEISKIIYAGIMLSAVVGTILWVLFRKKRVYEDYMDIPDYEGSKNPIIISVKNLSKEKRSVRLFGFNENIHLKNCGNGKDIDIFSTTYGSHYKEVLTSLALNPMKVGLIRIMSHNGEKHIPNVFVLTRKDSQNGSSGTIPVVTEPYLKQHSDRVNKGLLDIDRVFLLDAGTGLNFEMNPETELILNFYPEKTYGLRRMLEAFGFTKPIFNSNTFGHSEVYEDLTEQL